MSKNQEQQTTEGHAVFASGGEMGALMRSIDWSRTPVGPVSNWSQALRTTVGLLLRSRFPMLLWWGPRFVQFYNDAYVPIPGAKHPEAMLLAFEWAFAALWQRAHQTLGDVTLTAIVDRVIHVSAERYPILSSAAAHGFSNHPRGDRGDAPAGGETVLEPDERAASAGQGFPQTRWIRSTVLALTGVHTTCRADGLSR